MIIMRMGDQNGVAAPHMPGNPVCVGHQAAEEHTQPGWPREEGVDKQGHPSCRDFKPTCPQPSELHQHLLRTATGFICYATALALWADQQVIFPPVEGRSDQ
jgi:hypothetical protein